MEEFNMKGKLVFWTWYAFFLLSMGFFMKGAQGSEFNEADVCDCVKCSSVDSDITSGRTYEDVDGTPIDLKKELEIEDLETDYIQKEIENDQ